MKRKIIIVVLTALLVVSVLIPITSTSRGDTVAYDSEGGDSNNTANFPDKYWLDDPTEQWNNSFSANLEGRKFLILSDSDGNVYTAYGDVSGETSIDGLASINSNENTRWANTSSVYLDEDITHFPALSEDGNRLYIADNEGGSYIAEFDSSTGERNWFVLANATTSPKYDDDILYFGNDSGYIRALNTTTQSFEWSTYITGDATNDGSIDVTPTITEDYVYGVTNNKTTNSMRIVQLNKSDGTENWSYDPDSNAYPPMGITAYNQTLIYGASTVSSTTDDLYALNTDGSLKWSWDVSQNYTDYIGGYTVYDNKFIYTGKSNITARYLNNGTTAHRYTNDNQNYMYPTVSKDGKVLVTSYFESDNIELIDIESESQIWKKQYTSQSISNRPIFSDSTRFYTMTYSSSDTALYLRAFGGTAGNPSITPLYPYPNYSDENLSTSLYLEVQANVTVGDANVSFYDGNNNLIGYEIISSNQTVELLWDGLNHSESYEWYAEITDLETPQTDTTDVIPFTTVASANDFDWPTEGYNSSRSYNSPFDSSHVDGSTKWNFSDDNTKSSPVIDSEGNIYYVRIKTDLTTLVSLDSSGNLRWESSIEVVTPNEAFEPTLLDDSIVAVAMGDVYGTYWANNGTERWKKWLDDTTDNEVTTLTVSDDNQTFFFGVKNDNCTYAVQPDGKIKWKHTDSNTANPKAISVYKNHVYFLAEDPYQIGLARQVIKVNISDGSTVWELSEPQSSDHKWCWQITIKNDHIYLTNINNVYETSYLYSYNLDKTQRWSVPMNESSVKSSVNMFGGSFSVDENEKIYTYHRNVVDSYNYSVYQCFDSTGSRLWNVQDNITESITQSDIFGFSSFTVSDESDRVYFKTVESSNSFYSFDKSGNKKWKSPYGTLQTFAIDSEGDIIVQNSTETLKLSEGVKVETHSPLRDDVKTDEPIKIQFTKEMNTTSLKSAFSYNTSTTNYDIDDVQFTWQSSYNIAIFDPLQDFKELTYYEVTVTDDAKSVDGGQLDGDDDDESGGNHTWWFKTGDFTPPTVNISVEPDKNDADIDTNITLDFSEPMNKTSVNQSISISVEEESGWAKMWFLRDALPHHQKVWVDDSTLVIDFNSSLKPVTTYNLTLTAQAEDLHENTLDGNKNGTAEGSPTDDVNYHFKTEWRIPLYIVLAFVTALILGAIIWMYHSMKNPDREDMDLFQWGGNK